MGICWVAGVAWGEFRSYLGGGSLGRPAFSQVPQVGFLPQTSQGSGKVEDSSDFGVQAQGQVKS